MSFDLGLVSVAIIFLAATIPVMVVSARRLPSREECGKLSETLIGEFHVIECFLVGIISAIALCCLLQIAFLIGEVSLGVTGRWSVAWKCLSVSSGVVLIFAVALHESVRSFNIMRQPHS